MHINYAALYMPCHAMVIICACLVHCNTLDHTLDHTLDTLDHTLDHTLARWGYHTLWV